ncbi:MAG: F0F1 ATP synthase subunit B [Selenomonas noxia]|uniref:F0F1 ATP synthase subunit B n=1 Tax=Selenomonas noxia TaxID=135083 RepID=UPI0032BF86F7
MIETIQGIIDLNSTLPIQIINFLILVALLRAVAYKPVVRMMEERKAKIAESIEKADADAAAAEATLDEYKAQLAEARVKAQEIVDLAEKRASEERAASIQATKLEIEQMKKSAQEQMEHERAHAVEQLKGEVVTVALEAAGKIIQKNLTAADNDAIIGEFIAKLDADKIGDATC